LFRIDEKNGEYENYIYDAGNLNSLPDTRINSLCYDSERDLLWIATENGLCSFNYREYEFTRYYNDPQNPASINSNDVNVLYMTGIGKLWIGTSKGLDRFDEETGEFIHYFQDADEQNDINYEIGSIYEGSEETLWIGTNKGLIGYNPETDTFNLYTENDGLPNNNIVGVMEDNGGDVWLMIDYSIVKLSVESGNVIIYGPDHGLYSNAFYYNAMSRDKDGLIFVGTSNGLFSFAPEQITVSTFTPTVLINGFYLVKGGTVSIDEQVGKINTIELSYNDNSFIIDFFALDYISQGDNKYAYMLGGFDTEWQYCGPDHSFVRYTNMADGTYIFQVKASNVDQVWNENATLLKITISPPFWREWWFILLCIALGITIIWLGINIRMHNIQGYSRELELRVNEKTDELIQKSKQLGDELNRRVEFTHALVHELKTPLTATINSSEALISQQQSEISRRLAMNIYKSVMKLDGRINELLDFARSEVGILSVNCKPLDVLKLVDEIYESWVLEANKKGQRLELDKPDSLPRIMADKDRLEQILSNLISNALKFNRRKGAVFFKVSRDDSNIVFEIRDEGLGISREDQLKLFKPYQRLSTGSESYSGLGIGLVLSKRLVELQNGQIWLESKIGKGSSFFVSFPVEDII
jgi:signal transduction histidine kinase